MEEIWKPVCGFEEKYYISSKGYLKNIQTDKILKMTNKYGDYFSVVLYLNEKRKSTRIHRLVAEAFIPNPDNKPQVNHIDGNKQNNCVENLEWVTAKQNLEHAYNNNLSNKFFLKELNEKRIKSGYYGTQEHLKNRKNKKCSPRKQYKIYQYSTNMEFIAKYNSSKEASKHTGVCSRNILHCINHKEGRTQAGGFKWIKESEVVNCEKSI